MPDSNLKHFFFFNVWQTDTNSEVLSVSPRPRITFAHRIVPCWSNCYKSTARERPPKHSPPGRPKIDCMSPGLTPALPILNTPNTETCCRLAGCRLEAQPNSTWWPKVSGTTLVQKSLPAWSQRDPSECGEPGRARGECRERPLHRPAHPCASSPSY